MTYLAEEDVGLVALEGDAGLAEGAAGEAIGVEALEG
jgi:hypothetical protein